MKILNVIPYWGEWFGGPFINTCNFCGHATNKGHDVLILTTTQHQQVDIKSFPWKIGNRQIELPIKYCKAHDSIWRVSLDFVNTFRHIVNKFDLVLLQGMWQFPIYYAARYCRKHDIPYIFMTHSMLSRFSLSVKPFRKKFFLALLDRPNLERARLILYMKNDENEALEKYAPHTKKSVFINALNSEDIIDIKKNRDMELKKGDFKSDKILFLGRIHPKKGVMNLLRAFLIVLKDRPSATLTIAGHLEDRNYYATLRDFIAYNRINNGVQFTGPLDENGKKNIFLKTSVIVLPTKDDAKPLILIEAMGAGIPVITTKEADIPEIDETMGYITEDNPEEIAKKISFLIHNEELAKRMGANGNRYVLENFVWEKSIDNLLKECEDAIGAG